MRDNLFGYLLQALEPAERESLEAQLALDLQLQGELEVMKRGLDVLRPDHGHYDPPPGLAQRTCQFVAERCHVRLSPAATAAPPRRYTMADLVVAAGVFLAASLLFFPAVSHSRFAARVAGCQNNLRQLGLALSQYSVFHDGYFPYIPVRGSLAAAGIYAPRLVESHYLPDTQALVCPGSPLAEMRNFYVPTTRQLLAAHGRQLARLRRMMGGSYGYNLGYMSADGQYQPTKNLHRPKFAILADAPSSDRADHQSANHDWCGQNVLFEDGHVAFLTECTAQGCRDHIYVNYENKVAAGVDPYDAVIGASDAMPIEPVGDGD